jgi:hypothetical protein
MEVTLFWKVRTIGYASRKLVSSRAWGHINRDDIYYTKNLDRFSRKRYKKRRKRGRRARVSADYGNLAAGFAVLRVSKGMISFFSGSRPGKRAASFALSSAEPGRARLVFGGARAGEDNKKNVV